MALVSTTFHSIADSDPVWDTFLPSDYRQLISRDVDNQPIHHVLRSSPSSKDVYLSLSDHPLIVDAASMSFSLDKWTGKKCFMMAASALTIVWGDTPRYWRWTSDPESRAQVVGWPPIKSFRKNTLATGVSKNADVVEGNSTSGCIYVKVSMDGAPYLRKVDLKTCCKYSKLSSALENMFSWFTVFRWICFGTLFFSRFLACLLFFLYY